MGNGKNGKVTMADENLNLKRLVEGYREDIVQMGEEIVALKRSISSYKSANTVLKTKLERYKALDKEGDELNENKIAQIESLKETIKVRDRKILELEDDLEHYRSLPWYKRILKR